MRFKIFFKAGDIPRTVWIFGQIIAAQNYHLRERPFKKIVRSPLIFPQVHQSIVKIVAMGAEMDIAEIRDVNEIVPVHDDASVI